MIMRGLNITQKSDKNRRTEQKNAWFSSTNRNASFLSPNKMPFYIRWKQNKTEKNENQKQKQKNKETNSNRKNWLPLSFELRFFIKSFFSYFKFFFYLVSFELNFLGKKIGFYWTLKWFFVSERNRKKKFNWKFRELWKWKSWCHTVWRFFFLHFYRVIGGWCGFGWCRGRDRYNNGTVWTGKTHITIASIHICAYLIFIITIFFLVLIYVSINFSLCHQK